MGTSQWRWGLQAGRAGAPTSPSSTGILPLIGCVILGKLINLSGLHFLTYKMKGGILESLGGLVSYRKGSWHTADAHRDGDSGGSRRAGLPGVEALPPGLGKETSSTGSRPAAHRRWTQTVKIQNPGS